MSTATPFVTSEEADSASLASAFLPVPPGRASASLPFVTRRWCPRDFVDDFEIAAVFREIARHRHLPSRVRVYRDGATSRDYEKHLLDHPPLPGEPWQQWTARLFRDRPFAVIANAVERLATPIASRAARVTRSWIESFGVPLGGVDAALFIGNYGYTPFGVHRDAEPGYLIHLGPAPKEMFVWRDDPPEAARRRYYVAPEADVLATGERHRLHAGDVLFIPAACHHVGFTEGLSASLALSLGTKTPRQLARAALAQTLDTALADAQEVTLPFGKNGRRPGMSSILRAAGLTSDGSVRQWLARGSEDHRLALLSNGGLAMAPLVDAVAPADLAGARIRGDAAFPILHRRDGTRAMLFVRRSTISLAMHRAIPDLVARLNGGAWIAVDDVAATFADRWTRGATLHVLSLMAGAGGIRVAP